MLMLNALAFIFSFMGRIRFLLFSFSVLLFITWCYYFVLFHRHQCLYGLSFASFTHIIGADNLFSHQKNGMGRLFYHIKHVTQLVHGEFAEGNILCSRVWHAWPHLHCYNEKGENRGRIWWDAFSFSLRGWSTWLCEAADMIDWEREIRLATCLVASMTTTKLAER
jgi:hypothetical protein